MVGRMLFQDVLIFIAIYAIFMLGFATVSTAPRGLTDLKIVLINFVQAFFLQFQDVGFVAFTARIKGCFSAM